MTSRVSPFATTATDAPWSWRYQSPAGLLPKIRAKLRLDQDRPGHAQLKVAVHRGAFASLPAELPLRAIVRRFVAERTCAKIVHDASGSSCNETPGGALVCR